MSRNGHRARLSLKESIFTKMLRCVSEQHAARNPDFTVKARRSASTVSDLQQRHVSISAIPEGFLAKRTMDSVASLAGAASRSGEMRLAILRFD